MSSAQADRFLGTWQVQEHVFAPGGQLCGQVLQTRQLYEDARDGHIIVSQFCRPSESLRSTPMGAFAGVFEFRLQRAGAQRLYLGPDVEGYGTNWGDIFLCGEGVWPRFAFNFRSWSIRISPSRQLTGGIFFRASQIVAVIIGVGTLEGETAGDLDLALVPDQQGGTGQIYRYDAQTQGEESLPLRCELDEQQQRKESYGLAQVVWRRESKAGGVSVVRACEGEAMQRGYARGYGPLIFWDIYGQDGRSTSGLDIYDAFTHANFSIRRNYLHGRLVSLEGLQWKDERLSNKEPSRE